jgi:hypothetical protein
VVTDGPYAESKDLVTGSMIFEAACLEDAIDVARTCPTYEFGGSVEVRAARNRAIDIIRREQRHRSLLPELATMTALAGTIEAGLAPAAESASQLVV